MTFDEDDGTAAGTPPPPPNQRLWRHPSEVAHAATTAPAARRPARGTQLLVAAAVCAVATVVVRSTNAARSTVASTTGVPFAGASIAAAAPTTPATTASATSAPLAAPTTSTVPGVAALRSSSAAPLVVALGVDDLLVAPWQDDATGNVAVQTLDGHQLTATVIGRAPGTGLTVLRADQSLPGLDVGACANMTTGSVIDVAAGRETFTGRISETYTLVALLDGPPIGPAIRIELERPAPTTGAPVILHGGKVIAIVVATADHALYAVPVEVATTSARSLAGGDRSLAWLGIGGNDTNAGPTITEVERSSPAALAGLKAGDVIEAFDATSVGSMWSVLVHVRSVSVGSTVVVAVRRDGIRLELRVVLTALNVA